MPAARFRPAERPAVISAHAEDPAKGAFGRLGLPTGRRLLAFVAAAVIVVLVLLGACAHSLLEASRAARATENLVGVTAQATTLAYELQQERDQSAGFVSSGRKTGADLVALEHVDVDNALTDYRSARAHVSVPSGTLLQERLNAADAQLVKLDQLRKEAEEGNKPVPAKIAAEYSTTIGALIAILPAIADDSSNPALVASARALGALAEAKEAASQQRGFLFGVLTVNKFANQDEPAELTALKGKLQGALDHLYGSLDGQHKATYDSTVDADAVKQSDSLVDSVRAAPAGKEFDVGAAQWYDTVSTRIDLMREAETLFTTDLIDEAGKASAAARWRLLLEGTLLLLVLAATLGLVLLLALTRRGHRAGSGVSSAATRRRVLALAGQRPAGIRGSADRPADLKDVIHAAATQIDDQARVVQGAMAPRAVTTAAVGDVMVIVTELLDNAAAFSNPETRVFVKAKSSVDGGAVVEVEDQGSGMSAGELAAANALLAGNVDEGSAGQGLGLFVVGQLAARHGIQVQLRPSEDDGSGVTAVVRLPAAVVVLSTAARGTELTGTRETPLTRESSARATAGSAALREGPGSRDSGLPRREPGASRPDLSPFGSAASTGETTQIWDFPSKPREVPDLPWSTGQQPAVPPAPQGLAAPGDTATSWTAGAAGGLFGTRAPLGRAEGAAGGAAAGGSAGWDATPPPVNRDATTGPAAMPRRSKPDWEPDADVEPAPESSSHWTAAMWGTAPSPSDGLSDSGSGLGRRLPSERFDMPGPADVTLPDISRVVPPINEPDMTDSDVRLSIFDAIESEWFRQRAVGDYQRDELSDSWEQPAVAAWSSPADEGWRAAERLQHAQEAPAAVTSAGLPQRVPMANYVPGSIATPEAPATQRPAHPRSAEMVREMLSTYHRGVREGRHAKHRR
jgi:signal transduction histidine kinase